MAVRHNMAEHAGSSFDPTRLSLSQLIQILQKSGSKTVTEKRVLSDLGAGAPQNADGTLHLMYYAAWLFQNLKGSP